MYNPDWLRFCKRLVRAGLGTDHLLMPDAVIATEYIGSVYGGWTVADRPLATTASPTVLSFGLGDDISFDEGMIRRYGARVYGFDPTPGSLEWLDRRVTPAQMTVYPIGLANFDGSQKFVLPPSERRGNFSARATLGRTVTLDVARYQSIVKRLDLNRVDLVKLDIEGSEYDVLPDLLSCSVRPLQLLVEFHHRLHDIHVDATRQAVALIRKAGFSLFAVSPGGQELSFIAIDFARQCHQQAQADV